MKCPFCNKTMRWFDWFFMVIPIAGIAIMEVAHHDRDD